MNKIPKGFTLIELLVVISIITFLLSAVIGSASEARRKAHNVLISEQIMEYTKALALYKLDHDEFPLGSSPNVACLGPGYNGDCGPTMSYHDSESLNQALATYIPSLPTVGEGQMIILGALPPWVTRASAFYKCVDDSNCQKAEITFNLNGSEATCPRPANTSDVINVAVGPATLCRLTIE